MAKDIYLNKHLDEAGEEFITVGQKVTIKTVDQDTQIGVIAKIPSATFYAMVEALKSKEASPILYYED